MATTVIPLSSADDSQPQPLPPAATPESESDVYARIAERQLSTAADLHVPGLYPKCAQIAEGIILDIAVGNLRLGLFKTRG